MKISTRDFLLSLYGPEQEIAVRTFYDKKLGLKDSATNEKGEIRCNSCGRFLPKSRVSTKYPKSPICWDCCPKTLKFKVKDLQNNIFQLKKYQKMGHGIHLAINCGQKDADCTKAYAQFFEIDNMSFEKQYEIIKEKSKLRPSIIVKTRKSLHVYYIVKNGDIKRFRTIQKKLALYFGADEQKANESTCMRIPGFYHLKKDPIMVEVIHFEPNLVYSQDEIEEWLPDLPEPPRRDSIEGGFVELTGDMQEDIFNMMRSHIRNYEGPMRKNGVTCHCIMPGHQDKNISAILFKEGNYYCKGCGTALSGYNLAKIMGWSDVETAYITYFNEQRKRGN